MTGKDFKSLLNIVKENGHKPMCLSIESTTLNREHPFAGIYLYYADTLNKTLILNMKGELDSDRIVKKRSFYNKILSEFKNNQ